MIFKGPFQPKLFSDSMKHSNGPKLKEGRFRLDIRKKFFTVRPYPWKNSSSGRMGL